MRDHFVAIVSELAERDSRIVVITADLGFGVLDAFRSKFGRRYINVGVCEQNMMLVATGMALEGSIVFTYSIGNFPTLRCLEMIRNGPAYHAAAVKIVAVGGGFSYGSLGVSHHATEDIAVVRAIPGLELQVPGGTTEVVGIARAIASRPGPAYIRLDKDPGGDPDGADPFVFGKPRRLTRGTAIAMLATGGIVSEALKARELMARTGHSVSVYSVHSLRPLCAEVLREIAQTHDCIVTLEEHAAIGGLGSAVLEALGDSSTWPRQFLRLGIPDAFPAVVGSQQYLRRLHQLDAEGIAARVLEGAGVAR